MWELPLQTIRDDLVEALTVVESAQSVEAEVEQPRVTVQRSGREHGRF